MSKKPRYSAHKAALENKLATALDDLAEFEQFQREILPELRRAVVEKKSAKTIYKMAEAVAAAKAVTIMLTTKDETKALAAIKEVLDRGDGKATEHKAITLTNVPEEQLDAILEATEAEAANVDKDTLN